MISFVRSADLAPGRAMEAMAFAGDIAKAVEKLAGVSTPKQISPEVPK